MIQEAANAIKEADYLLISAGAGMGVDSGLPDFRGSEGFWRAYPAAKRLGLRFEELANPRWFEDDPHLAWAFYGHRLNLYRKTQPHEGFAKLLKIAQDKKDYFVFTSNVDGQFQKAGFAEDKIYEIHGSIHFMQCTQPCSEVIWSANGVEVEIDEENFKALEPLPRCINCSAIARPNILMFGDWNWVDTRAREQESRFAQFLHHIDGKLVIVEIGAGKAVPTVRMMDEEIAKDFGATLIRINPREPDESDVPLAYGGKEALDMIYTCYQKS
ncbi:Sir2 family NAD-dependent protein deacetylase [Nitratiruptor sp. YY09-18]|uniref:SIR2 family NAD-dependent protein deacylase n=1 Tax=Nitratiruptor sp. YY09-18 TaxID=2724901 RepID=UPI001915E50C|nr:Sir2 family NAD-dependent protein deacetylase [Nitratiruptor sp. YY09-18]BCD68503.1 hypothetical protein NitYY0918_C1419 [Nitratiruptor sp. YY09-18]